VSKRRFAIESERREAELGLDPLDRLAIGTPEPVGF
jgi:hypothetical protein